MFTTPYRPSSNGCVERVNRTLGEFLRSLTVFGESWDVELGKAVMSYNHTKYSELGQSPSEFLLFRAHPIVSTPVVPSSDCVFWKTGSSNFNRYVLGQLVRKKIVYKGRCVSDKLKPRYDGHYSVVTVNGNGVEFGVCLIGMNVLFVIGSCRFGGKLRTIM